MSLKLKFGFRINLCFAHLAGAISRKNGGRKGLVYFNKYRLKFSSKVLNFVSLSEDFGVARKNVINKINILNWKEGFYRKDIGYKVIK